MFYNQQIYNGCLLIVVVQTASYDQELFKDFNKYDISKVRVGNGEQIVVKSRGTIAIKIHSGVKLIFDVLYVFEINQNL